MIDFNRMDNPVRLFDKIPSYFSEGESRDKNAKTNKEKQNNQALRYMSTTSTKSIRNKSDRVIHFNVYVDASHDQIPRMN